jgi:catechol 2,3-dioxygenase-like lactoylglutathione lyase family enzyme
MTVSVGLLDHYNIHTRSLDETVRFYQDALGLEVGPRPPFRVPGAWMYSEGRPVVHLMDISGTDQPQKSGTGAIHHVAFVSRGFEAMKQRLDARGVAFHTSNAVTGDVAQIFVTDPNGVVVELNYDMNVERS